MAHLYEDSINDAFVFFVRQRSVMFHTKLVCT